MINRCFFALAALFTLTISTANATPIDVEYEIQTYSSGGFSASWLHSASGCAYHPGPDSGSTLYMCGDMKTPVTGNIVGTLDDGVLTVKSGSLSIFGKDYDVLGGSLGGHFSDATGELLWFLQIEWFGSFYFENIAMTDGPNRFGAGEFILWGQNYDAYGCDNDTVAKSSTRSHCEAWGIDLYATRVPEPGTLALIAIGLFAFAVTARRRPVAAYSRVN